jgi:hypothetical protein
MNLIGNAIKFTSEGEVAVLVSTEERDEHDVSLRFEVRTPASALTLRRGSDCFSIYAGRLIHDSPLRWHRPRPGHLDTSGRAYGR